MDENTVRKFSVNARVKLRRSVESSMARLGVGPGHEPESIDSSGTTTVLNLPGGLRRTLNFNEAGWRIQLLDQVTREGYDNVVEKIAYTWFNRIIAIRYMEVNDFLPTHVRVLSSTDEGKIEPDIVTQCISVADAFGLSSTQKEEIITLKQENRLDKLFSRMFIHECNSLSKILPGLFTGTESYERLLLDLPYTVKDGIIRELVDTVPEEDFRDAVQIIGWMYQYYNTELKDLIFNKKKSVKISKEHIPAATQLFTPDWIVRYMVENSLGRVWLEGHPDDSLQSKWRYYLQEAEQEPQVQEKLRELRAPRRRMKPTEIKVIDPCMGSGHVLVYAFDVLMQIYESYGYSKQDAASFIIENNLFGLDIDERAYQLAYFAVMMKARSYDPDIFSKGPKPNIYAMVETCGMDGSRLEAFGNGMDLMERGLACGDMKYLFDLFKEARTYGSLIKVRELDYNRMHAFLKARPIDFNVNDGVLRKIVAIAEILSQKYDAVITNPPYLSASGMNLILSGYIKDVYPESKSDLFACFIERCFDLVSGGSYVSMITMHAFMFLTSFEKMRQGLINSKTIVNMVHQGAHGFDQIGGEVVQTVAFTISNDLCQDYVGTYCRLIDDIGESAKKIRFLSGENRYYVKQSRFDVVPGELIAYWVSDSVFDSFIHGRRLNEYASPKVGLQTGDNDRFLRYWFEIDYSDIGFDCSNISDSVRSGKKWFPYNKGGEFRKWYGNTIYVVDWYNDGKNIREKMNSIGSTSPVIRNSDYYFHSGYSYTDVTTGVFSCRKTDNAIFDTAGPTIFSDNYEHLDYIAALLNSVVGQYYLTILSPTLHYTAGAVSKIPVIHSEDFNIEDVTSLVEMVKHDWNMSELSFDFIRPYLMLSTDNLVENACKDCLDSISEARENEKKIESRLDSFFTVLYQINNLDIVERSDLSIKQPSVTDLVKQLVSYSVGCMFGRYSIERPGIQYSGGEYIQPITRFEVDTDNIIPFNDHASIEYDVTDRFVEFIKVVYGDEYLEENLRYVADNLGIRYIGTARDGIRKYFLNNFYDDHIKMYQKCPIYWMFDSGKENGFKALIYMHRYTPDLISKMRQDYFLPLLSRYRGQLESAKGTVRIDLQKKIEEMQIYDIAMEKYASEKVSIDLDDGVKVNYAKFQNIDNPGSKKRIDLLHPLK